MQDRRRETADALQNVGGDSSRKRRAITHTFIIIALSGTVCKGKKSSAKRVFTGSYGILTNRPYNTTIKSFSALTNQLVTLLPEKEKKSAGDELMSFITKPAARSGK